VTVAAFLGVLAIRISEYSQCDCFESGENCIREALLFALMDNVITVINFINTR
jgi:hypothetical protein